MASEVETLDNLLNKATNPANREEDWDHMMMFCDRVNKDIEGPMISVRLLAHKLQSPQEREALFALLTLETCVKNCGSRFQSEIGKFRFLNEIIKVVSPKYLGTRTSENVKKRCIELMYSWTRDLSHEPKIGEAYAMLKTQGIVKEDPAYIDKNLNANPAPPPRPKNALFEDDEKARLLSRLLKSKNPEDLQAANRLIKNMVQQDADRIDKISKRVSELETINNNVSVLSEMLEHYGTESASQSDRDTMKELYETLEKLRPNLFRLASDTDEQDNDGIADILKANDEVMKVMNQYKLKVDGSSEFGTNHTLLDLGFDQTTQSPSKMKANLSSMTTHVGASILDEQLLALGLSDPPDMKPVVASTQPSSNLDNSSSSSTIDQLSDIFGSVNVESSNKLSNVITANNSTTDATPSPIHSVFNMGATNTPLNSGMAQGSVFPNFTATSTAPTLATGSFVAAPKNKPQAFGSMATDSLGLRLSSSTSVSESQKKAMEELDMLGKTMLMQSLSKEKGQNSSSTNSSLSSALSAPGGTITSTTTTTTTTITPTTTATSSSSLSTIPAAAVHSTNRVIGPFIAAATTTTTITDTIGDLFSFNGDLTPSLLTNASTTTATTSVATTTTTTDSATDMLVMTAATTTTTRAKNTTTTTSAAATTTINSSGGGADDSRVGDAVGSLLNFSTKPLVPVGQQDPAAYTDGLSSGGGVCSGSPTLVPKEPISLSDVFVPLESVEPGTTPSIHAYDKDSLKIVIHFAKNKPRQDVLVLVVSVMNSGSIPIRNFLFQAAVPKMMKVKLQPPSATDLPSFNPILPPAAITQVMLLANPLKEKIRLKYKITYYKESVQLSDVGEIDDFPAN